ncbi:uncharacterized protein MELLADRAFT_64721 [Melampsora larici-populina 98AG31]|uniref:Uncharacterized protein n=1 Tax=Melampsora larici-populina (strain 98AG31 / pathotype 3-4-7) TaxID=747676 RepID=F4RSI8_MELLP|nr:uncharacterized protein MELLADRAFT_64721 [Melampsora larici-populina 98AG31]EGG04609.1 hypothetical protein MELLADRAFT_64721 [Melampsora larici-populina 98AG31]
MNKYLSLTRELDEDRTKKQNVIDILRAKGFVDRIPCISVELEDSLITHSRASEELLDKERKDRAGMRLKLILAWLQEERSQARFKIESLEQINSSQHATNLRNEKELQKLTDRSITRFCVCKDRTKLEHATKNLHDQGIELQNSKEKVGEMSRTVSQKKSEITKVQGEYSDLLDKTKAVDRSLTESNVEKANLQCQIHELRESLKYQSSIEQVQEVHQVQYGKLQEKCEMLQSDVEHWRNQNSATLERFAKLSTSSNLEQARLTKLQENLQLQQIEALENAMNLLYDLKLKLVNEGATRQLLEEAMVGMTKRFEHFEGCVLDISDRSKHSQADLSILSEKVSKYQEDLFEIWESKLEELSSLKVRESGWLVEKDKLVESLAAERKRLDEFLEVKIQFQKEQEKSHLLQLKVRFFGIQMYQKKLVLPHFRSKASAVEELLRKAQETDKEITLLQEECHALRVSKEQQKKDASDQLQLATEQVNSEKQDAFLSKASSARKIAIAATEKKYEMPNLHVDLQTGNSSHRVQINESVVKLKYDTTRFEDVVKQVMPIRTSKRLRSLNPRDNSFKDTIPVNEASRTSLDCKQEEETTANDSHLLKGRKNAPKATKKK